MEYYHDLVTEKSWRQLQRLNQQVKFILIGGWAVYLYTKALKSKDIDIIIEFNALEQLGEHYRLSKNERLKKYEARKGEVQIDVYLPHYSRLGIPVGELVKRTKIVEGFTVLKADYLLALKLFTLMQRRRSAKGKKDLIDAVALLRSEAADWQETQDILREYELTSVIEGFEEFLREHYELPELELNHHQFAQFKKGILE